MLDVFKRNKMNSLYTVYHYLERLYLNIKENEDFFQSL